MRYTERYTNYKVEDAGSSLVEIYKEEYPQPKTEIIDTLINKNTGEETVIYHGSNAIVRGFGVSVGLFLSSQFDSVGLESGIRYAAFGDGEGAVWDSLTTAQRQAKSIFTLTQLYHELFRVVPISIVFLDTSNNVTLAPTNKIEVRISLDDAHNGNLREFGLFLGNSATATLNTGILIDHKAFPVISFNQDSSISMLLNRAVRITT